MDVNPTAVLLLQYLIFLLQPPKPAPVGLPPPASRGGCAAAQAAPPHPTSLLARQSSTDSHLLLFSGDDGRTSKPSYSPSRGQPLPSLPRFSVVPFLGIAVVHCLGAVGAAWSMSSTNDFHRKSTVRGEADNWVHGRSKEVPPYYAENNYSST